MSKLPVILYEDDWQQMFVVADGDEDSVERVSV